MTLTRLLTPLLSFLLLVALIPVPLTLGQQNFSIGTQFSGTDRSTSGFIPPDTMGAIGPSNYVEAINGRFSVYDRSGTPQSSSSLNSFWNTALSAGGGGSVQGGFSFDPRIMYDRHSDRWFATSVDAAGSSNSGILVGVTTGNNPATSNWRAFRMDADGSNQRWADFPTMGINNNWVTITNNMFGVSGGTSSSISVWSIPTSSLTNSTPSTSGNQYLLSSSLVNSHGFTLHPVYDYSNNSPNTAYLASRFNNTNLQLSTLTGSINSPTLTGNNFFGTANRSMSNINAPQLGPNDNIDAGGNNITGSPVLVNGKIWGVHSYENSSNISRTAIFRIDAATNTLEYESVIPISDSDLWTYYPSIAVNELGDIAVAFSGSDDSQYVGSFAIAGHFDGTNVTWATEQLLQAGQGNYVALDGQNRNRWGDYSAIQVDPNNPRHFWTIQEYADGTNSWRMRITELIVVPEPGGGIVLTLMLLIAVGRWRSVHRV